MERLHSVWMDPPHHQQQRQQRQQRRQHKTLLSRVRRRSISRNRFQRKNEK